MKRFVTFPLLWLLPVWLIYLIPTLPAEMKNPSGATFFFFAVVLLVVAVAGFVPALLVACADFATARRGLSRAVRLAVCAVLGCPAGLLALWIAVWLLGLRTGSYEALTVGLSGVVASALCSWVASRGERSVAPPSVRSTSHTDTQ